MKNKVALVFFLASALSSGCLLWLYGEYVANSESYGFTTPYWMGLVFSFLLITVCSLIAHEYVRILALLLLLHPLTIYFHRVLAVAKHGPLVPHEYDLRLILPFCFSIAYTVYLVIHVVRNLGRRPDGRQSPE